MKLKLKVSLRLIAIGMAIFFLVTGAILGSLMAKKTGLGGIGIGYYDETRKQWIFKEVKFGATSAITPVQSVFRGTQKVDVLYAWSSYKVSTDIGGFYGVYCILAREEKGGPGEGSEWKPITPAYVYYDGLIWDQSIEKNIKPTYPWPFAQGKHFTKALEGGPYSTQQIFPYSVCLNGEWVKLEASSFSGEGTIAGVFLPVHDKFDHIRHSEAPTIDKNDHNLKTWLRKTIGDVTEKTFEIKLVFMYLGDDLTPQMTYNEKSEELIAPPVMATPTIRLTFVGEPAPEEPPYEIPREESIIKIEFPEAKMSSTLSFTCLLYTSPSPRD